MITPVIINRLRWKAYLIFMATNLAFVPIFYFFYPETSRLRLEDIDLIFTEGGNPVGVAASMQKELGGIKPLEMGTFDTLEIHDKKQVGSVHREKMAP